MSEDNKNVRTIVGREFVNNKKYKFTVIGGNIKHGFTILFRNGTVKENVCYQAIMQGRVRHPKPHLGETNISTCGQVMTIIDEKNWSDVTVRFSDGSVVPHKQYKDFLNGNISNPNYRNIKGVSLSEIAIAYYLSQIGFNKANKGSIPELGSLELDAYNPDINGLKIAVEYDGYPWHLNKKRDIEKNKVCKSNNIKLYRIREPGLPYLGHDVTQYVLTSYHQNDINKLYNIASEVVKLINRDCGTSFSIKKSDKDRENIHEMLNSYYYAHRIQRLGETRVMSNGLKATIIEYISYKDITLRFEDNFLAEHKSYYNFKTGKIANPNVPLSLSREGSNNCNRVSVTKNGKTTVYPSQIAAANALKVSRDTLRKYLSLGSYKEYVLHRIT